MRAAIILIGKTWRCISLNLEYTIPTRNATSFFAIKKRLCNMPCFATNFSVLWLLCKVIYTLFPPNCITKDMLCHFVKPGPSIPYNLYINASNTQTKRIAATRILQQSLLLILYQLLSFECAQASRIPANAAPSNSAST